jgi:GGDEF domain-containing protein
MMVDLDDFKRAPEHFAEDIVARADRAMYAAKRSGGDQVHHGTGW